MTPEELRNPLNVWKELVTPDGRIYYFNKLTMTSSWPMPEELRAARGRWVAASGGAGKGCSDDDVSKFVR